MENPGPPSEAEGKPELESRDREVIVGSCAIFLIFCSFMGIFLRNLGTRIGCVRNSREILGKGIESGS